jgi:ribonuclease Y
LAIGYFIKQQQASSAKLKEKEEAENIINRAGEDARNIILQAKDKALETRQAADGEVARRRSELSREEDRLQKRREEIDSRTDRVDKREQALNKRQSVVDKRANDVEKMYAQELEELQRVSQMSIEEARNVLLAAVEKEARADMARVIRQIETEAREEGDERARKLIADAIQRVASEHVSEVTTSFVPLPSDEMKGRIIGRNGRNIHAFEQAAGVDVIVDDTPEAITIPVSDTVRRGCCGVRWLNQFSMGTPLISKRLSNASGRMSSESSPKLGNKLHMMLASLDCTRIFSRCSAV